MYKHISVRRFKLVLLMRENIIKIWMVEIREDDTLSSPTANDEMFNVIKQASLYLFSLLVVVVGKLGVKDMEKMVKMKNVLIDLIDSHKSMTNKSTDSHKTLFTGHR